MEIQAWQVYITRSGLRVFILNWDEEEKKWVGKIQDRYGEEFWHPDGRWYDPQNFKGTGSGGWDIVGHSFEHRSVPRNIKMTETVDHPTHYNKGKIECIDFIEDQDFDFNLGNAIKYIVRSRFKGTTIQDLEKAKWYIDRYISKNPTTQENGK